MTTLFRIFLRKLKTKPVFSFITIIGFTVGIMASLMIYLWVSNELGYEKFHPDYQRIYRVVTLSEQGDGVVKSADCSRPLAATLEKDYPQIEYATYTSFSTEDSPLQISDNSEKIEARRCILNDHFFNVFEGFTFKEGTPENALSYPSGIILSVETAHKLFGDQPALGKKIIDNKYVSFRREYTVSAVIEIPAQSHIDFDFAISDKSSEVAGFLNDWRNQPWNHVYFKLKKGAEINSEFMSRITNQISRYSNNTDKLMFQPLADIHLHSDYKTNQFDKNISSYTYVWIFSGLAVLVILMASLNFSLLSVARASERLTEIGMKKVNGASRFQIAGQFLSESLLQTLVSLVIALALVWIILPLFNNLSGQQLKLVLSLELFSNIFLLTIFVGLIAGAYPAWYLSSLIPAGVLKSRTPSGSSSNFLKLLPLVQFIIAIFFVVATAAFIKQMNYIRNKDLGFDNENMVVVPTGLWYNNTFKEELLRNPDILNVTASSYAPIDFSWKENLPYIKGGSNDSIVTSMMSVDEDFANTYKLEIIKGEFLKMNAEGYWEEVSKVRQPNVDGKNQISLPVVINETAERMLGLEDPIGERLGNYYVIVGVVKDFHYRPLRYPIEPLVLYNSPENLGTMNIRIAPGNKEVTLKFISETYQKTRDDRTFSYQFFDDMLNEKYSSEIRLRNLTFLFAVLAILIAVLGILGMSVFTTAKRTKEIGIRKVNGAKVSEILAMLNKDFVKWVVIAFVIATPVAYYAMNKWLQNFAYKTNLSWWIFALAGLLALGIALLTVSWQSWRAATRNPVEALRYE